nr:MAG TPA: protein of unknown function (DUF5585) [Caudoviricetes sp.]
MNWAIKISIIFLKFFYLLLTFLIHISCSVYRRKHYLRIV